MDVNNIGEKLNAMGDPSRRAAVRSGDGELAPVELSSKWKAEINAKEVVGSTAGAGSGDFHIFKNQRRREMFRLKRMYDDAVKEKRDSEWEANRQAREDKMNARTARNRAKRLKRKAAAKERKNRATQESDATVGGDGDGATAAAVATPPSTVDNHGKSGNTETTKPPSPADPSVGANAESDAGALVSRPKYVVDANADLGWVRLAVHCTTGAHMTSVTNKDELSTAATRRKEASTGADDGGDDESKNEELREQDTATTVEVVELDVATPGDKKGATNSEVRGFIAHALNVGKTDVDIVSGHGDVHKVIQVQGVSVATLVSALTK